METTTPGTALERETAACRTAVGAPHGRLGSAMGPLGGASCAAPGALRAPGRSFRRRSRGSARTSEDPHLPWRTGFQDALPNACGMVADLTNNKDPRKAADSWKVISATISIFSAVLIFQCINGVLSAVLLWTGASDSLSLGISFAHMLVWMFCLHICLAWIASKLRDAHQDDVGQVQAAELNMKCFAVLLGHTTGFAAIRAFALGQHMVPGGALQKLIIVPLSWIALFLLDALCDKVRNAAIMADGKVSWFEHVWNNLVEEYEDDIIGLTSAFLIVQTFRLWLTG
ncbi:unnamed protein product, partial [Prorocentrum cordatum]